MTRSSEQRWAVALGSAALSLVAGALIWDLLVGVLLVLVLALHELGHAAAMRALGYRVYGIIFLPALGGLTVGFKPDASRADTLATCLAGPVPGVGLGLLLMAGGIHRSPAGGALVYLLLSLNLLNLLPVLPFDGGQVVAEVLSSRRWGPGGVWGSAVALGGLSYWLQIPGLLVPMGLLVVLGWRARARVAVAPVLPRPWRSWDVALLLLYVAALLGGIAGLVKLVRGS